MTGADAATTLPLGVRMDLCGKLKGGYVECRTCILPLPAPVLSGIANISTDTIPDMILFVLFPLVLVSPA